MELNSMNYDEAEADVVWSGAIGVLAQWV